MKSELQLLREDLNECQSVLFEYMRSLKVMCLGTTIEDDGDPMFHDIGTVHFNKTISYISEKNSELNFEKKIISMEMGHNVLDTYDKVLFVFTKELVYFFHILDEIDQLKMTMQKDEILDNIERVVNDPKDYNFNVFWQSNQPREQRVVAIIRNYLSTMDRNDIFTLCKKFGVNRVKSELILMYKEMYKQGYVDIKGMKVPLEGRYDRNPSYKELVRILDEIDQ